MFFISIQSTYDAVELALFNDSTFIDSRSISKLHASKLLILTLEELLATHQQTISNIQFIATNQGPGPFTTLRVVIASVNGLSFATQIPLIGIDGLDAFVQEYQNPSYPKTVILLNAFNFDVYFAIQNKVLIKGYKNIDLLLSELQKQFPQDTLRFLGNATELYRHKIQDQFGPLAFIPDLLPLTCSVKQIGLMGLQYWQQQEGLSQQLLPLYLKQHSAEIKHK